jgi:hypothetical protein
MGERKPTADEIAGMAWWNNLSERERSSALQLAKANTAAEAWDWQKSVLESGDGPDVRQVYGPGRFIKAVSEIPVTRKPTTPSR